MVATTTNAAAVPWSLICRSRRPPTAVHAQITSPAGTDPPARRVSATTTQPSRAPARNGHAVCHHPNTVTASS